MALGFLEKKRMAIVGSDRAASRTKVVLLTSQGRKAQDVYRRLLATIEARWNSRFGADTTGALRKSLERLVGEPDAQLPALFRGLKPYPGGWRAAVPRPTTLPHYPMVLHRGGFPDGS